MQVSPHSILHFRGSQVATAELRNKSADILLMIQSDMLAYHSSDEPMQLGLPDIIGSPLAARLVANISAIYAPELKVGYSPTCCSDHQSFHQNGMILCTPLSLGFPEYNLQVSPQPKCLSARVQSLTP